MSVIDDKEDKEDKGNGKDIADFQTILFTFAQNMPFDEQPDLLSHWDFIYQRCLGCVGTLKRWLVRAVELALDTGANTVTREHLEATALPLEACVQMAIEITRG